MVLNGIVLMTIGLVFTKAQLVGSIDARTIQEFIALDDIIKLLKSRSITGNKKRFARLPSNEPTSKEPKPF